MAHRICGDISDELKFILDCGISGPPIVEDWKRANAYACRYQDENVILNVQVQALHARTVTLENAVISAMSWAGELGSEYLDGDPDTRKEYLADMDKCRKALKDTK